MVMAKMERKRKENCCLCKASAHRGYVDAHRVFTLPHDVLRCTRAATVTAYVN